VRPSLNVSYRRTRQCPFWVAYELSIFVYKQSTWRWRET